MSKLISRKKKIFPPLRAFDRYLRSFNRTYRMPLTYHDLLNYDHALALYDASGEDLLWSTLTYARGSEEEVHRALLEMYAFLRGGGDLSMTRFLQVDRVDLCMYGNTKPFRIRISNRLNDNFEYFYIKQADASRIFGLELEHILSPNRIIFFTDQETLLEEHIYGIPGDLFRDRYLGQFDFNSVRFAKEFVKFNERCFLRLLGDMHASNFVVDVTMDFESNFYRIRSIDFDQQSYEGTLNVYRPQFFKENYPFVKMVMEKLPEETVYQYQVEERTLIQKRMHSAKRRLDALLHAVEDQPLSEPQNIKSLALSLCEHYDQRNFLNCHSMGALVRCSLEQIKVILDEKN